MRETENMTAVAASPRYDDARAEAFAEKMTEVLNHGALCLMVSVGHRTGLFDTMSMLQAATPGDIAASAGLNERYVREWLGAMVTARVVELDWRTGKYRLPTEYAAYLTRAAAPNNLAVYAQYIACLGSVEDAIIACFREGGGVPYEKFPRFHEVMEEDSGQTVLAALEPHILPLIPGLTDRLEQGIRVLDVGCGRARVLMRLAELYPRSSFVGMDLSEEAITYARNMATDKGLHNLEFLIVDLSDFDTVAEPESFDFITSFDAIHDQAQPLHVLKGIYRALKPDGIYLMQDIRGSSHVHKDMDHPIGTFLYTVSCMHCMTVSLAQGGEGLGAMWGEAKAREYLEEAGFGTVITHQMAHDIQNNWYVVRKNSTHPGRSG